MVEYPFVKVAELPNQIIYAQRTPAGGIAYYTDQYGVMAQVVDMTIIDEFTLKMVLQLHKHLEQKSRNSTGTRFDIMEMKEREKQKTEPPKKMRRVDNMNRCIKCRIVQPPEESVNLGIINPIECDFYGCPQKEQNG
jgi:hypothetical protein